jgi:hypothetical protein
MGLDLDRLERLAGGLAVLFYVLLFLAFITAIMGSGGGGLLLLLLGAVAHVGRVGLEDFVERRREFGDAVTPEDDDAGERAIGLRLRWLPAIRLPRRIDLGAIRSRGAGLGGLGRVGAMLGAARSDVRASFAALVAEIKERPAGARRSFDLPHQGVEDVPEVADDEYDNFAVTDGRYEDFEAVDGEYEEIAEPELGIDSDPPPAPAAPTAQERYEARQRARAERGEAEPIVAAVEAAETQRPQRVQRRQPGGRPDPLRTRRPTRTV